MQNVSKPSNKFPKGKAALAWGILLLNIVLWPVVIYWMNHSSAPEKPVVEEEQLSNFGHIVFTTFFGVLGILVGIAAYFGVLLSNCMTFDFSRPVWEETKPKIYVANIIVPMIFMLGVGFLVSAVATPMLKNMGVSNELNFFVPIVGTVCVLQVVLLWVVIWAPLEKRLTKARLLKLGVTPEQMVDGIYIGLSDPTQTDRKKRMFAIEEDIGMLWFSQGQLIYWGDREQFGITREQLVEVERKADTKSTTMLSGIQHVVLHVRMPNGFVRQIRLHTEGAMTMGGRRKSMDELGQRINEWRAAVILPPPVPPPMGQLL